MNKFIRDIRKQYRQCDYILLFMNMQKYYSCFLMCLVLLM